MIIFNNNNNNNNNNNKVIFPMSIMFMSCFSAFAIPIDSVPTFWTFGK